MQISYPMKKRMMKCNRENIFVTIELINIVTTINTIGNESLVGDVAKGEVKYYVVMPTKSTIVNKELATNSSPALVVNKYMFIMKMGVETKTFKHTM